MGRLFVRNERHISIYRIDLHIHRLSQAGTLLGQLNQSDHFGSFSTAGRKLALSGQSPGEFSVVLGPGRGLDRGSDFADGGSVLDGGEGTWSLAIIRIHLTYLYIP